MTQGNHSTRVFVADDSAAIRCRIAVLLDSPDTAIVGEGETPGYCIDAILALRPDVVVLDVQLRGGSGLEVLRAVRGAAPDVSFVVFTNNTASGYRERYLMEGALRFLDKTTECEALAQAVAQAAKSLRH